ncbi:hypothetical protein J6V85_03925 [Candidatus Saccharibacteria bacterium]|nr:hypothetical protein [Candidatus Saccharibacteria bacterium]
MREIKLECWPRLKTYKWFKTFSDSTYGMNVRLDITKLLEHTRRHDQSFFINMLYVVVTGLNSLEEMRMRLVDDKPVVFDDINPAYTVMAEAGTFENVRHKNCRNYSSFYKVASEHIESAKKQKQIKKGNYNPENCYDEYYITCTPWVDFTNISHPIPDDVRSQCIPRVCWGKFVEQNGRYELTLNITVSHIFVDGYHLAQAFNIIQDLLNNADELLS